MKAGDRLVRGRVLSKMLMSCLLLVGWLFSALVSSATAPPITALAFSPDGKSVLVGSQAGLQVLSWPDPKPILTLQTELAQIHDLSFSPRGDVFAIVGGSAAEHGTLELFGWPTGELLYRDSSHEDLIYAVDWTKDASVFVTSSLDRSIRVYDAKKKKVRRTIHGHSRGVLAVCCLPDDRTLITAGIDLSLRVWDLSTGENLRTLENHTHPVHDLALRPSQPPGSLPMVVSVSDDRTVRLWQPTIGRLVRFARLPSIPLAVAWSNDGRKIVTSCADGHVRVIDPDTVEILIDLPALNGWAYSVAVSPIGEEILLAGQNGQLERVFFE